MPTEVLLQEILQTLKEIRDTLAPAPELELVPEEGGVERCTQCGIELHGHWGYVCGSPQCPYMSSIS